MKKAIIFILAAAAIAVIALFAAKSVKMSKYCEEHKPCSVSFGKRRGAHTAE